ncbi:MAG TPA: Trp biosynthesis-associated membrane protein [Streptosporangiaceae bacterium]|nr:Trp biosynthesis-associated membrane protein [Streptosporangiaceae bacterium]
MTAGRQYAVTLAVGVAGSALVLLSLRQGWARVVTGGPAPLPSTPVQVSGQALVPLVGALALASLAGLAAVLATSRGVRRAVGVALMVFGVAMAVALCLPLRPSDVRAAAVGAGTVQGGSATAGAGGGDGLPAGAALAGRAAGHVAMVGAAWRPLAVAGALLVVAAGLAVAWRGGQWAVMSSRYSRDTHPTQVAGSAGLWDALSMGVDPTEPSAAPNGPGTTGVSRE